MDLTWEQAYARTYVVQVSTDGSTWTDAKAVDNSAVPLPFNGGDASLQTEDFTAPTARYVRISGGARATSWGNSLWTLSVIDSAGPAPTWRCARRPPPPRRTPPTRPANATDGNPGTRWSSEYEDDQWIQVDLGSPSAFDRVAIVWEAAYPKTYVIQVSDDGQHLDGREVGRTTPPSR